MKNSELLLKNTAFGLAQQELIFDDRGNPEDFVILDGNPALAKILGLDGSAIAGTRLSEVIPGIFDGKVGVLDELASLRAGDRSIDHAFYSAHTRKHYHMQMNAIAENQFAACYVDISKHRAHEINLANQEEKAVIGTAFDIASREESEEIIRRSEERFRMVMQHMPNMANAFDEEGRLVFWNKACERITGYKAEEVLGNPDAMRWMYPDDDYREKVWQAAQDSYNSNNEATLITKSGKKRIISWDDTYHKIKIPGWSSWGIGEDVTERREAETIRRIQFNIANAVAETPDMARLIELIRTELAQLIDTANFYIALYDQERGIFHTPYAYDQADAIAEWDAEKSLTGLVVKLGTSLLVSRQEIQELIGKGVIQQVGSMCEVWMGVPLSTGKKITGVLSVQSYDDPHAFDENSLALLEFISTQIGLTVQLRQYIEDLKIAKQRAEESDQLKTAFLNNISHEIRTPLNSILGFGRLLSEEGANHEDRLSHIRNMQVSSKRLIDTIEGMLDLAMVVSGSVQSKRSSLDLEEVFDDLHGRYRSLCEKKGLQLMFHAPESLKQQAIQTDPMLLYKALSHLVDNAIKFTKQGSVEVGASNSSGQVVFFVRDTGVGMDPEYLDQAFEPFSQEDIAYTRGHEGSGMGLAIARGLIRKLGGNIWVNSAKGKGSTFYFSHPS